MGQQGNQQREEGENTSKVLSDNGFNAVLIIREVNGGKTLERYKCFISNREGTSLVSNCGDEGKTPKGHFRGHAPEVILSEGHKRASNWGRTQTGRRK